MNEMLVCRELNGQFVIGLEDGENFIVLSMHKRKENAKQEAIQQLSHWTFLMATL